MLGVLSEGKLKRCPFVKRGLEINSSRRSEGPPTGTKAQLWSCNLSFLPCVPNYSRGLLLLEVFFLLGLLPCLALNTLALDTFVSSAFTLKGLYRINLLKQTFNLVLFSL